MNDKTQKEERLRGWSLHAGGAAVVGLVIVGFALTVYFPIASQHEGHVQRIEQLDQLLGQSRNVQKDHRRLRAELAAMQEAVASTRSRLPQEALEAEFVIKASKLAKKAGLQVIDYRQQPASTHATHSKTEVRFNCRGSYASVCHFLKGVSQLARLTKISKLDMQSATDSESYPFQVTFDLYYGVHSFDTKEKQGVL